MKRNQIIKITALSIFALGMLSMSSCMDSDINRPLGNVSNGDLQGDNYVEGAFFINMLNQIVPAQENGYQENENMIGGELSRYFMFTKDAWNHTINYPLYEVQPSHYSSPFESQFSGFYQAYNEAKNVTGGEGVNFAWAQVLRVAMSQRMTDTYGPLPYSKVNPTSLSVPYDTQEEVYTHMFEDLDNAITVLTNYAVANPSAKPMAKYDGVYGGDFTKWVKFANSLKLRMAIHVRFANPTLAKQKAEEAVHQLIGVITSNEDNASYLYSDGNHNPLEIMWNSYGDTRICADILTYMEGYKDPRESKYFQPHTNPDWEVKYAGMRSGIYIKNVNDAHYFSSPVAAKTDRLMWLSASEVAFLKAEGALAGWDMGGTAKDLYESGVKLSFEQWGAGDAGTYLADGTSTQADYLNPSDQIEGSDIKAASTITIKWNDNPGATEENLERIITQKWIALYPLGTEAWTEMRRTGYPKVFKLFETPMYPVDVPNRLPFSNNEYTNNKTNIAAAVGMLGGPDTWATRLWWQRKN